MKTNRFNNPPWLIQNSLGKHPKCGSRGVVHGEDGPCKEWRMERQMAALLFIQSQPLPDVQELVRFAKEDADALDERLLAFELEIPLNALTELATQIEADSGAVAEAQFEIEPKPGERSEAEPPNS